MSNFYYFSSTCIYLFFSIFKGIARNLNGGQSTSGKGRNGAMAYSMPN